MRKKPLWCLPAAVLALSATTASAQVAPDPLGSPAPIAVAAAVDDGKFKELPILTWQQEFELQSTVRQVLMNTYLPFLSRPTDFRGVHNDPIPNKVTDWAWHRDDVRDQLRGRQVDVDRQTRGHAGLPDAEVSALMSRKDAFRPEDLEKLITKSPRLDDIVVKVLRVQPLGVNDVGTEFYRLDFEVKTLAGGITETSSFERIDVVNKLGTWIVPTRVIFEVAPIARATASLSLNANDPLGLLRSGVAIVLNTARDISPIDIPRIPLLEQ